MTTPAAAIKMAMLLLATVAPPVDPARAREPIRRSWMTDPRSAVLLVMGAIVAVGLGHKARRGWLARQTLSRLDDPTVSPEEIERSGELGRATIEPLMRLFTSADRPELREAAGRALSVIWAHDQLVAEEERAIVTRGYAAQWTGRRRYPRGLREPIALEVSYGLPFLQAEGQGVRPDQLEWSHRVTGTRLARFEDFSAWAPGPGRVVFALDPADFAGNGPHQLVLECRVRTQGLTSSWEVNVPQVPFRFEFDPRLQVESLLSNPSETDAAEIDSRVSLCVPGVEMRGKPPTWLPLGRAWMIKNPPLVHVERPLSFDLAHHLFIEIEGLPGRIPAGSLVIVGAGSGHLDTDLQAPPESAVFDPPLIERPGIQRIAVVLEPSVALGWAHPAIRAVWPSPIRTQGVEVEILRP